MTGQNVTFNALPGNYTLTVTGGPGSCTSYSYNNPYYNCDTIYCLYGTI